MSHPADIKSIEPLASQAPLTGAGCRIEVSSDHASRLLAAAERLPLYDNQEFYSTELQTEVRDRIRSFCEREFDWLTTSIQRQTSEWPYWALVSGLRFDSGNRLFVAVNRAFGELVAPPFEKPRVQLVHYIQPATDLRSSRGGRESERLHTDTADWKKPVELISMVCVRPDRGGGGRSKILDVDTIRNEVGTRLGAKALETLQTQPVPWKIASYSGGGVDWRPVLTDSSICWRRYTIDLGHLPKEMLALLDAFEDLITNTTATANFLMREDELLFSDNTRTIHSRTPISADELSDRLMIRSWIRTS